MKFLTYVIGQFVLGTLFLVLIFALLVYSFHLAEVVFGLGLLITGIVQFYYFYKRYGLYLFQLSFNSFKMLVSPQQLKQPGFDTVYYCYRLFGTAIGSLTAGVFSY